MAKKQLVQRSLKYWNNVDVTDPQFVGVHPMGGGGLLEIGYRHHLEVTHFLRVVPLNDQLDFLEMGCGNGRWAVSLGPLVHSYTGVDFSEPALAIATASVKAAGLQNVHLHLQTAGEFVAQQLYDVIYLSGMTQYLDDDDLRTLLTNLRPQTKATTILVDRSTVNYQSREYLEAGDYITVIRTPDELRAVYAEYGYQSQHAQRSYRFLRGAKLLQAKPVKPWIGKLVQRTAPRSYSVLEGLSALADRFAPIPFEGGNRSHDLMVFKRG